MKRLFLISTVLLFTASCEKKTESNVKDVMQDSMTVNSSEFEVEELPENCYLGTSGKDSIFMKVVSNLGTITGKMYYKNFQKDSSFGQLIGTEDGDTLKMDYTFQSEGTTSTREIWFLMKDGKVLEGIGDFTEDGTTYKDYHSIKYEGGHELSSADCKTLEKHFKKIPNVASAGLTN